MFAEDCLEFRHCIYLHAETLSHDMTITIFWFWSVLQGVQHLSHFYPYVLNIRLRDFVHKWIRVVILIEIVFRPSIFAKFVWFFGTLALEYLQQQITLRLKTLIESGWNYSYESWNFSNEDDERTFWVFYENVPPIATL